MIDKFQHRRLYLNDDSTFFEHYGRQMDVKTTLGAYWDRSMSKQKPSHHPCNPNLFIKRSKQVKRFTEGTVKGLV